MYFGCMRLFGLKVSRIKGWEETLKVELGSVTWEDRVRLVWGMVKALIGPLRARKSRSEVRSEWFRRMRVCGRCPVYDRCNKRCRPFKGSVLGCGCYMPYAALFKERCWADENLPKEGIGWDGDKGAANREG